MEKSSSFYISNALVEAFIQDMQSEGPLGLWPDRMRQLTQEVSRLAANIHQNQSVEEANALKKLIARMEHIQMPV